MPSGAKKRKAAKKKKELGANITSATTSQGNEDANSQYDKGSDSGDVASPASPNHQRNPFSQGNKETRESRENMESAPKAGLGTSGTESQRDWKFENNASESKNGSSRNARYDDNHSSTSSSDESLGSMKKSEVTAVETIDLSVPTASVVYSVTPEVSASEETITVAESASVENTAILDMIASEKLETHLPTTDVGSFGPSKQNGDRVVNLSGESVKGSSGALESASEKYEHKTPLPDVEDSGSLKFSKTESEEPLIASERQVAQRTSWLSCCGLCDVLTGSNR